MFSVYSRKVKVAKVIIADRKSKEKSASRLIALAFFQFSVDTDNIELVVLDDANQLLEEPNKDHVYSLLKMHLTWYSQIIMLSTNYPKDLDKFVDDFMNESVRVILKKDDFFSLEGKIIDGNRLQVNLQPCTLSLSPHDRCPSILRRFSKRRKQIRLFAEIMQLVTERSYDDI